MFARLDGSCFIYPPSYRQSSLGCKRSNRCFDKNQSKSLFNRWLFTSFHILGLGLGVSWVWEGRKRNRYWYFIYGFFYGFSPPSPLSQARDMCHEMCFMCLYKWHSLYQFFRNNIISTSESLRSLVCVCVRKDSMREPYLFLVLW